MTFEGRFHSGGGRLLAVAALLALLQPLHIAAVESPPTVNVTEANGTYTVAARFLVDQPPSVALAVLTDYEQIPRFMPDVRTSIVRERGDGWALVEQAAVSHMMMFSKRIHLVLEIQEQARAVVFRDTCRRDFNRYEGAWRLSSQDGRTVIDYELTAVPSFDVPGFLLKRLLRRDSGEMIERLQREIAARATAALNTKP